MPVARPSAMARKITPISRAVPGTERKRTRLNAPATATPAPTLPLTSMMTICTIAGRTASVTAKPWLHFVRYMLMSAVAMPSTSDTAVQMRKAGSVIPDARMDSSTAERLL